MHVPPDEPSLAQWVSGHQPAEDTGWGPGFWDYVEFLEHLQQTLALRVTVPDSYVWSTPAPEEALLLPVFRIAAPGFQLIGKNSMLVRPFYIVSVKSEQAVEQDHGLTTEFRPSPLGTLEGFPSGWEFPPFTPGCRAFTARVGDEYDLYALLRLVGQMGERAD